MSNLNGHTISFKRNSDDTFTLVSRRDPQLPEIGPCPDGSGTIYQVADCPSIELAFDAQASLSACPFIPANAIRYQHTNGGEEQSERGAAYVINYFKKVLPMINFRIPYFFTMQDLHIANR